MNEQFIFAIAMLLLGFAALIAAINSVVSNIKDYYYQRCREVTYDIDCLSRRVTHLETK